MLYQVLTKTIPIQGKTNPLTEDYWLQRDRRGTYTLASLLKLPTQACEVSLGSDAQVASPEKRYPNSQLPLQIRGLDLHTRHFFEIAIPEQATRIVALRNISLKGSHNFRDLGGYVTEAGYQVRWGSLFRSDHLFGLDRADWQKLKTWGIGHICDLRGPEERKSKPDHVPKDLGIVYHSLPVYDPSQSLKEFLRMLRKARPQDFDGHAYMQASYRRFVHEFSGAFAQFLSIVLESNTKGVLVHCTGGKDRTGFASALLLKILGVPEQIIRQDYMASNFYRFQENQSILRKAYFLGVSLEVIIPILEVREAYLQAAFDEIEEKFGSFPAFLSQQLSLNAPEIKALKNRFLRKN